MRSRCVRIASSTVIASFVCAIAAMPAAWVSEDMWYGRRTRWRSDTTSGDVST